MQQAHDMRFDFQDFNGRASFYRLRVYEEEGKAPVVLATESVTNAASPPRACVCFHHASSACSQWLS